MVHFPFGLRFSNQKHPMYCNDVLQFHSKVDFHKYSQAHNVFFTFRNSNWPTLLSRSIIAS